MSNAEQGPDRDRGVTKVGAMIIVAIIGAIGVVAAAFVPSLLGSGDPSAVTSKVAHNGDSACNNATFAGSHNSFNCTVKESGGLSKNPRARIVELKGSWSEQGFVDAIIERDTKIVALYLKSGMNATTLHNGASAILFGFQGVPQNGDPVALVKTFQADGLKVDDELEDNHLMQELTEGSLPLHFETKLAPKGYTGGYWGGKFVGSLLFWIVQRETWAIPPPENIDVIEYLVKQGADCKVPLSFLEFNSDVLADTFPYEELLPMVQSCA